MRTADDELARRVHVEFHVVAEEFPQMGGKLLLHARNEDVAHIVFDFLLHGFIVSKLIVLCADDDGVDAKRFPAFAVFHRHLRLGIRAEVSHLPTLAADGGQFFQQQMREVDGQRHVVLGFFAGEAEHHALVASTLVFRVFATYALENVVRLTMKSRQNATRLRIKLVLRLVVADAIDDAPRNVLNLNVCVGADFARHHDEACGH